MLFISLCYKQTLRKREYAYQQTAESVRQVKGCGAGMRNMALEWRTERERTFPTGCDGCFPVIEKRYQTVPAEAFCVSKTRKEVVTRERLVFLYRICREDGLFY